MPDKPKFYIPTGDGQQPRAPLEPPPPATAIQELRGLVFVALRMGIVLLSLAIMILLVLGAWSVISWTACR